MACACERKTEQRIALRGARSAAGWTLPGLGLLLMPKCPMCIAAWLALAGCTGVSLTAASLVRTAVLWLCAGLLMWMAVRLAMRLRRPASAR